MRDFVLLEGYGLRFVIFNEFLICFGEGFNNLFCICINIKRILYIVFFVGLLVVFGSWWFIFICIFVGICVCAFWVLV